MTIESHQGQYVDVNLPFETGAGDEPDDKVRPEPNKSSAGPESSQSDFHLEDALSPSESAAAEIAARDLSRQREAKIRSNRSDLGVMIAKNREERAIGGREWYLGFRLFRTKHSAADPQEDPYVGTVIPINVAKKHPSLLGFLTLDYQTVYQHEKLRSSTRIVVRPGKFTTLRNQSRRLRLIQIATAVIVAACGFAAYAFFVGLWPFQPR